MKRKLKYLLLWALGFSASCSDEGGTICMYGTPRADLSARGRVTDAEGNPIPGIEVGRTFGSAKTPSLKLTETDADGNFEIETVEAGLSVGLRFTDVDGEANGGDFATRDLTLTFAAEDRVKKGDDAWDMGDYAREGVDVALERKPAAEPAEGDGADDAE